MTRSSLRAQLVVIGLIAAVVPLIVLVFVVFSVEEDETFDTDGATIESVSESGVSPWIPAAALVLAIVAIVLVWFWAKRAVDPIERMAALTDDIQAGSLDRRLDLDDAPAEIQRLGASFDRMLDRLAVASDLERRRIEDASHELRTPLAALAARLEVAAKRTDPEEIAADIAQCDADVERLQATLELLLASARTRRHEVGQTDNDLTVIVERVVERQRLLRPDVSIEIDAPTVLLVGVDGASVERAIANLVTNAVEHGGGAPVMVEIRPTEPGAEIVVTDRGPGIDPDRLPTIFDRYAGDEHGLGLALVKQVADAYGSVDVESPIVDGGTRMTLRLDRVG